MMPGGTSPYSGSGFNDGFRPPNSRAEFIFISVAGLGLASIVSRIAAALREISDETDGFTQTDNAKRIVLHQGGAIERTVQVIWAAPGYKISKYTDYDLARQLYSVRFTGGRRTFILDNLALVMANDVTFSDLYHNFESFSLGRLVGFRVDDFERQELAARADLVKRKLDSGELTSMSGEAFDRQLSGAFAQAEKNTSLIEEKIRELTLPPGSSDNRAGRFRRGFSKKFNLK